MYCPKCGQKVNDDALYCEHCGAELHPAKAKAPRPNEPDSDEEVVMENNGSNINGTAPYDKNIGKPAFIWAIVAAVFTIGLPFMAFWTYVAGIFACLVGAAISFAPTYMAKSRRPSAMGYTELERLNNPASIAYVMGNAEITINVVMMIVFLVIWITIEA